MLDLSFSCKEDGRLTDSQVRTVSFKNTIIILTSNLGTSFKNYGFGFANDKIENDMLVNKVESALKDYFSPEFLNRIDDTMVFNKITKQNVEKTTQLLVDEYINAVKKKHLHISHTESFSKFIT